MCIVRPFVHLDLKDLESNRPFGATSTPALPDHLRDLVIARFCGSAFFGATEAIAHFTRPPEKATPAAWSSW